MGYDPLYKVSYPLDVMRTGMRFTWIAGKEVTIDESMIKYMGRAVSYVQYMPAKPIKHRIKVFAICCSSSVVMLAFFMYVKKKTVAQIQPLEYVISWSKMWD